MRADAAEHLRAARLRDLFIAEFRVRECRWSGHNLARLLRATGERPARVAELHRILGDLGMGHDPHWPHYSTGCFDHGLMWARDRHPVMITSHPYHVSDEARALLADLARFTGLLVNIDDRPSFYGWGSHHIRIELAEVRRPWDPGVSTSRTKTDARRARRAFVEEGLPPILREWRPPRYRRGY